MWQEVLNIIISNGIFAVLFVFLLTYLLKDSSKREKKYTDLINSISQNLNEAINLNENSEKILDSAKDAQVKLDENNHLIKKVHDEVKVVKKDVKEIKKIIKTDNVDEKQV